MAGGRCSSGENPAMFLKEQSKAGKGGPWCAAWWPHIVGEALVRWQRAAEKKAFSVPQKKKQFLQLFSPFMPRYECKAWDLCPWDSGCGCQE